MHLLGNLSKRELQVTEAIAWGNTKKEVADALFISYNTVDSHVKNIYRKLGIRKETDLTRIFFIERFNIPIGLNPIKQQIIASIFLLLTLFSFFQKSEFVRVRTRTSKTAKKDGEVNSKDDCYYLN